MFFLFSGEGPTDLGSCADGATTCMGADYDHGPVAEAWMLGALESLPHGASSGGLEDRSGNDDSPNSLKAELRERLGEEASRELLCRKVRERIIDFERIDLPSFIAFRDRLLEVI